MERNYKLDLYKGIAAIGVLWIHVGTFVSPTDTAFLNYTRELASLIVPIFFIISGYFLANSKNVLPGTIKLLKTYFIMAICTIVFYQLFIGTYSVLEMIKRVFDFSFGGVGYLWFIKMLIYYRLIIVVNHGLIKKKELQIIIPILCIIFSILNFYTLGPNLYVSLLFCSTGYLLQRLNVVYNVRFNSWLGLIFVCLIYLIFGSEYNTHAVYTFIAALITFLTAFQGSIKSNPLEFYSRNSLNLLFVHYFVLNTFLLLDVFVKEWYVFNYIILLATSSLILYGYETIVKLAKE